MPSLSAAWGRPPTVERETVQEHLVRRAYGQTARYETVHSETLAHHALPCNVRSQDELPDERGWWGYSFRDVPARTSGETFIATIPDCRVVWYRDPAQGHDFYPAILTNDNRALDLREIRFRPLHAEALRRAPRPLRVPRATWIVERVYHNYSHWLTAHVPKLLLLRGRNALADVWLPQERTAAIDGSLRLLGLDASTFPTFAPDRPLRVDSLTLLGTDRFRPELLRLVPPAFGVPPAGTAGRKVFISRARASRRRLVNEDAVWPLLERDGFERVQMEALAFADQVALMRDTAVLCAPHGAGLTNMLFCPPGVHVVEIADRGFPNPNFYALAAALGHHYWCMWADALGECHPLEKDLRVDPAAVRLLLPELRTWTSRS